MPVSEAAKKFWTTPELVEGLLPFLDPPSLLKLSKAHPLIVGIMLGPYNWISFVRRTCPYPPAGEGERVSIEEYVEQNMANGRAIVGILHMMGNPQFHILELLEIICERFPPTSVPNGGWLRKRHVVKVTSDHGVHSVSELGFVLLESIEEATDTVEQRIESVLVDSPRQPLLPALVSRLARQERSISHVEAWTFVCENQADAEAFLTLAKHTEEFTFRRLIVRGAIGESGWAALAEALRLLPPWLLVDVGTFPALVVSSKNLMLDGKREDVKAVWDAIPVGSWVLLNTAAAITTPRKAFHKTEEDWVRLEEYLDNENAKCKIQ